MLLKSEHGLVLYSYSDSRSAPVIYYHGNHSVFSEFSSRQHTAWTVNNIAIARQFCDNTLLYGWNHSFSGME